MSYVPHFVPNNSSWPPAVPGSQPPDNHGAAGAATGPPSQPPLPRKAQRRRKRHVPVGPAGVWFQNFQSSDNHHGRPTTNNNLHLSSHHKNNDDVDDDDEEEEDQQDALQNLRRSMLQRRRVAHSSNALTNFSSPAWIAMQCDCRWVTPSLASHLSIEERCEQLRPHVPSQFTMIPELIGNYSSKNNDHSALANNRDPWFCEHAMVLVSNIHGSTTANGWTVTLTDETGATLTAWIQPDSIRRQLQCPNRGGVGDASSSAATAAATTTKAWLRTGCVLWLQNTTLLLSPDCPETGRLSFLLLVGEVNVKQVWTPSDGESLSDERYIQWIEQRSQVGVLSTATGGDEHGNHEERRSSTPYLSDHHGRMRERSVSPLRGDSVQGLPSHTACRQISTPILDQSTASRASLRQSQSSENKRPKRATTSSPASPNHTQQTLTSAAPSDLPTIASSPRPGRHKDHESQFAAFRSTYSSQDEVAAAKLSPFAQTQTTNDCSGDTGSKRRRLVEESAVPESVSQIIQGHTHNRPSHLSQIETQISTPNERTTQTRSRKALNSTENSASSKKRTMSSLRKRRRRAMHSKLWTGAVCPDFSDDDDDEQEDDGTMAMQRQAPEKAAQKEEGIASPKSKRSLFRQYALQELANILSSDDESDQGV
eukprot:scaffold2353_cov167-Amphora_coffeaeformis.AAC.62